MYEQFFLFIQRNSDLKREEEAIAPFKSIFERAQYWAQYVWSSLDLLVELLKSVPSLIVMKSWTSAKCPVSYGSLNTQYLFPLNLYSIRRRIASRYFFKIVFKSCYLLCFRVNTVTGKNFQTRRPIHLLLLQYYRKYYTSSRNIKWKEQNEILLRELINIDRSWSYSFR